MIPLRLQADFTSASTSRPFVIKIEECPQNAKLRGRGSLQSLGNHQVRCDCEYGAFSFRLPRNTHLTGDVLLCVPERGIVQRLLRRDSRHNTLLFTEQCDQLCIMCSQPPRQTDDSWRFPLYREAIRLSDTGAQIGISGGEPTIYKRELLELLSTAAEGRADVSFHVLSNAQHFDRMDLPLLSRIHSRLSVTWGIPLYSCRASVHDTVVQKRGAFDQALDGLYILAGAGATIELRTVLQASTAYELPRMAKFVRLHLPFISIWSIMGLEPVGYARANWDAISFDHSQFPDPLVHAVRVAHVLGLTVQLYNLPLCTVPAELRPYCADSISDWKRKFLRSCAPCTEQDQCCGFFEWYGGSATWSQTQPLIAGLPEESHAKA